MNADNQKILILLSEAAELDLPPHELIEFVRSNVVGSSIESLMRIRALTELSAHTDTTTLIALAAASNQSEAISRLVSALEHQRRH